MKTKVKTKSTALSPRPDATKVASNTSDSHSHSSSQIVTCRLDSIEFGMDIESVQEIVRLPKITPVPKAPHYVRGLANLRGNVLPVIDPRLRFGMESAEDESNCRVVVLEIGGVPTGLIVDAVREVMTVDDAAVQPPPSAVQGVDSQFLRGVVKLDGGNRLVMLIDQDKIIDFDEIDLSTTVHDAATTSTSARGAEAEQSSEHDYEQLVSFRIGDEEYAFSIMDVKEIIRLPEITIVPDAPCAVEGITALRDHVVPVVNLRTKFGFPTLETQTDAFVTQLKRYQKQHDDVFRATQSSVKNETQSVQGQALDDCEFHHWYESFSSNDLLITDLLETLKAPHQDFHRLTVEAADLVKRGARKNAEALVNTKLLSRHQEVDALFNKLFKAIHNRDDERCLVIGVGEMSVALRIDAVNAVMRVPRSAIEKTPDAATSHGADDDQIRGVAKLDKGRRLIMLLDVAKLMRVSEIKKLKSTVDVDTSNNKDAKVSGLGQGQGSGNRQLVTFKIGDEEFASDIMLVQEIVRLGKVTKVPHAPAFLEGVVNLRGNVLPVIDMRRRFGMPDTERTDATRVVVVDSNNRKTGIIVDAVSEVLTLPKDAIEPAPAIIRTGFGEDFIEGVGKIDDGERMLLLLRTDRLLGDEALASLAVDGSSTAAKGSCEIEATLDAASTLAESAT